MLNIESLSIKNFMSVGAVPQEIKFSNSKFTLVLGENIDLGGSGSRNGVGKSTIVQALCYALFGSPITNIKRDNLINKTNNKNMLVTIDFNINSNRYRIERGRRPNTIKFLVNNKKINPDEESSDETHGESRVTQLEIEKVLGFNKEVFKHIIALNTSTEPFLSQGSNQQRLIIEELLGITQLSKKAETLKELSKKTKDEIANEEFKIKTLLDTNAAIQNNINNLKLKSSAWETSHKNKIIELENKLTQLIEIDIEEDIKNHELLKKYLEEYSKYDSLLSSLIKNKKLEEESLKRAQLRIANFKNKILNLNNQSENWDEQHKVKLNNLEKNIKELKQIDIEEEIEKYEIITAFNALSDSILEIKNSIKYEDEKIQQIDKKIKKTQTKIKEANTKICPTCKQSLHDSNHLSVIADLEEEINKEEKNKQNYISKKIELEEKLKNEEDIFKQIGEKPKTVYKTLNEAYSHKSKLNNLLHQYKIESESKNPYSDKQEINELNQSMDVEEKYVESVDSNIKNINVEFDSIKNNIELLGEPPETYYKSLNESYNHKSLQETTLNQLNSEKLLENPYVEQITSLENNSLQPINYDNLNYLTKKREHQEFLWKLLTNKDSFIRKKIIDQNLSFLNYRLSYYLEKLGLPHEVKFLSDLSVEISELGREYDFDNLSRGEKNRLIIGLSFAFRDVWESLNNPINLLFIDELIDSGLDPLGVEASLTLLKNMGRNQQRDVFLISHREELLSRVTRVLLVKKENGFTILTSESESTSNSNVS